MGQQAHQVLEVILGWMEDLDRALTDSLDLEDIPAPEGRMAVMGIKAIEVYQALWGTMEPQALLDQHLSQTYMGSQGTLESLVCLVFLVQEETLDILDQKALMGGMVTQENMGLEVPQVIVEPMTYIQ